MFLLDGTYKIPPVKEWTMEITHTKPAASAAKPTPALMESETFYLEKERGIAKIVKGDPETTFERMLRDFMQPKAEAGVRCPFQ